MGLTQLDGHPQEIHRGAVVDQAGAGLVENGLHGLGLLVAGLGDLRGDLSHERRRHELAEHAKGERGALEHLVELALDAVLDLLLSLQGLLFFLGSEPFCGKNLSGNALGGPAKTKEFLAVGVGVFVVVVVVIVVSLELFAHAR